MSDSGVPANNPQWTVDSDGWLISPSTKHALASWDHAQAVDADCRMRPEDFAALVECVRGSAEIPDLRERLAQLTDEVARLREGLGYIAEPDALLDANEEAFNEHAARRMQEQARYLLTREATDD